MIYSQIQKASFNLHSMNNQVNMGRHFLPLKDKGTYILILKMEKSGTFCIGRLGEFRFPKGFYTYVGSAMGPGGIAGRVSHHLTKSGNSHWHIDYLRKGAEIIEVWWGKTETNCEHFWASAIGNDLKAVVPAEGFGSTDCRCQTHLYYFKKKPKFDMFQKAFNLNAKPEHLMRIAKSGKGGRP